MDPNVKAYIDEKIARLAWCLGVCRYCLVRKLRPTRWPNIYYCSECNKPPKPPKPPRHLWSHLLAPTAPPPSPIIDRDTPVVDTPTAPAPAEIDEIKKDSEVTDMVPPSPSPSTLSSISSAELIYWVNP